MISEWVKALRFGRSEAAGNVPPRSRLAAGTLPSVVYAVGDVHGCYKELRALEDKIFADSATVKGVKWIVMLGDYVDRGPESARVIDHLMAPLPEGFERICLAGNHEVVMLSFLSDPAGNRHWLELGGVETLRSYGLSPEILDVPLRLDRRFRQAVESHIPEEHVAFLKSLPILLKAPQFLFVHAGIRPGVEIEDQQEHDLLWIRGEFLEARQELDFTIIHGHTPVKDILVEDGRIDIDTGAYATGLLSAARISQHGQISFLNNTGQEDGGSPIGD